jgi:hypothetical protein
LPDGYRDITGEIRAGGFPRKQVTIEALEETKGYLPTIVFQLAPIWGGTMGDLELCKSSANSIAGPEGKVRSASMIAGPSGKVCQMYIAAPQGVALITEVISYSETWLMTCNHADGDTAAERVCRSTLAAFKFKPVKRAAAKVTLPRTGVRECDDYLDKMVACGSQRLSDAAFAPMGVMLRISAEIWKKAAASKDGMKTLPAICTKAANDTRPQLKAAGCE